MTRKNARNMKVCGSSGYKYKTVPAIMLKGLWLNEWGFGIDDEVVVKCENGKLVIEKVLDETDDILKSVERVQCVAEKKNNYCKKERKVKQEGDGLWEKF